MHMQCKETHKCNQNRISRVRVKLSKIPSRVARNCRRPRTPREERAPVLFIWGYYSSGLSNCHGSKSEPKSPNPANRFEKTDFERNAKHGLLCQIQSRHLNILFWGNLGNPDSLPKATCPSSPKLPRLGNLGTIGEGHFVSTPARPVIDRPLLTMISIFENIVSSYSGY